MHVISMWICRFRTFCKRNMFSDNIRSSEECEYELYDVNVYIFQMCKCVFAWMVYALKNACIWPLLQGIKRDIMAFQQKHSNITWFAAVAIRMLAQLCTSVNCSLFLSMCSISLSSEFGTWNVCIHTFFMCINGSINSWMATNNGTALAVAESISPTNLTVLPYWF